MEELNLFLFVTNLFVIALIGALMPVMLILTRKAYLFGVKIPGDAQGSPEALVLKKRYIFLCATGAVLTLGLAAAQYIAAPDMTLLAVMYFPLIIAAVQTFAYITNWRAAVKLKEEKNWKALNLTFAEVDKSRGKLSEIPWLWYVAGLVLTAISVIIVLYQYPHLPEQIPTHFGLDGQPDD
jgi:uncharacterized membrane protein